MAKIHLGAIKGPTLLQNQCIICDTVLYQDSHRICEAHPPASDINVTSLQIRQTVYQALDIPIPVPTDPNGPSFFKEFKTELPLCPDCCFNVGCLSNIQKQIDYFDKQWSELKSRLEESIQKVVDSRNESTVNKENDFNVDSLENLLDPSRLTESLRNSEVQILRQIVYQRRHRHPSLSSLSVDGKKSNSPTEPQNENHSQMQDKANEGLGKSVVTTSAATSPMDTGAASSSPESLPPSSNQVAQKVSSAPTTPLNELNKKSKTISKNYSHKPLKKPTSILKNREHFNQKIRPESDPEPKDPFAAKHWFSIDHNYSYVDPYNARSNFMQSSKNVSNNDPNNKGDERMVTYWMFPDLYHSESSNSCNDPENANEDNGSGEDVEIMDLQIPCHMGRFTGTEIFDDLLVLDLSDNSEEKENGIEVECVDIFPLPDPEPSANFQVEVPNESQQNHSKDFGEIHVQSNYRVNGEVAVSSNSMATDQCGENRQDVFVTSSSSESPPKVDAEILKCPDNLNQWNSYGKIVCQDCYKVYSRVDYYKKHVKIHTEDAMQCVICKKSLLQPPALAQHFKSHCKRKEKKDSFSCSFCSESFKTKIQVSSHVKQLHEKPLHCEHCGKGYKSAIWLGVHVDRFHSCQK